MRICIVGAGYVGLVSAAVFAEWGHDVVCMDNDGHKVAQLAAGKLPVYEPGLPEMVERNAQAGRLRFTADFSRAVADREIVMIAVGTPSAESGRPDLTALWDVVRQLKRHAAGSVTVVLKSTVPIGTCEAVSRFLKEDGDFKFDVVSAPEFLRQGTAIADFLAPDRMVIGCRSEKARQQIRQLFEPLECPAVFTDWQSAEMIKYAANAFLALKISYINTIANLCEETGANVHHVALGMGLDHRIGPSFLKPGAGFGGSCLPKDTQALAALGEANGVNVSLLRAALEVNHEQRMRVVGKLEEQLGGVNGKKIAVLGLAFKANTNDVREAPALTVISRIVEMGGKVTAYDPVVDMESLSRRLPFTPASDAYDAVSGADAVVILTEWEEFYGLDLRRVRNLVRNPLVVDGRNLYAPQAMKQLGFCYLPAGVAGTEDTASALSAV